MQQLTLYISGRLVKSWNIDHQPEQIRPDWKQINCVLTKAKEESAQLIVGLPYDFFVEGVPSLLVKLPKQVNNSQSTEQTDTQGFGKTTKIRHSYHSLNRLSRVPE